MTSGLVHPHYLDEFISSAGGGGCSGECFHFQRILPRNFCKQTVDPDQIPHAVELHLYCLHMSPNRDLGLVGQSMVSLTCSLRGQLLSVL